MSASRADLKQLGFETIKMKSMCFINIKNLNYEGKKDHREDKGNKTFESIKLDNVWKL